MVLFAGDLFHENKPSRQTMHKTMEIIRTYCCGSDPVNFQIVSDQASNFRTPFGRVNYEDVYHSIDLPIFAIHGNHDDPTRDSRSNTPLAALDLLSMCNLVNYFGVQSEVSEISISPILIQKGSTKVALYGLGSMRDERLNRMWQSNKVRFLRPEEEEWFNLFTLHQNRDLGRGSKNCVHESMIPEWMDFVVWGHEHECLINPVESLVGTYRISQPGSSVATSLAVGESVRKRVGILDIKGEQFRMTEVPLTQVRSFCTGEVMLGQEPSLDPDDPNVDKEVVTILTEKVRQLIEEAREKDKELTEDSAKYHADNIDPFIKVPQRIYKLAQPGQVLARVKVEHTGFSTVNNQRFGHAFIGEVANPSDVLLFHRKRREQAERESQLNSSLHEPVPPEELEELNVEDLVKDTLINADQKLELLQEEKMGLALEHFVAKEQKQAIDNTVEDILMQQRQTLVRRGQGDDDGNESVQNKITTKAGIRELCLKETDRLRAAMSEKQFTEESQETPQTNTVNLPSRIKRPRTTALDTTLESDSDEEYNKEKDIVQPKPKPKPKAKPKRKETARAKTIVYAAMDSSSDDNAKVPLKSNNSRARKKPTTVQIPSEDDFDEDEIDSDEVEDVETPPSRVRGKRSTKPSKKYDINLSNSSTKSTTNSRRKPKKDLMKQSQLSFEKTPSSQKSSSTFTSTARNTRTNTKRSFYVDDDSEEEEVKKKKASQGWGTAATTTRASSKRRRTARR